MAYPIEDLQQVIQLLLARELVSQRLAPVTQERVQVLLSMLERNQQESGTLRYSELMQFRQQLPQTVQLQVTRNFFRQPQVENRTLLANLHLKELIHWLTNETSRNQPEEKQMQTKELTLEDLKNFIGSKVADLGPYNPKSVLELLQFLEYVLIEYPEVRKQVADYLADLGYASLVTQHMGQISVLNVLDSEDACTLSNMALCLCLNLSTFSAQFAKFLARDGAVELLTQIIINEEYLSNGAKKEIVSLMRVSVDIINNIARHEPTKACFKEQNTAKALKDILIWNNGCLEVRAMLTLAMVMDDEQLVALTDDNDNINTIVDWLNRACDNKAERKHDGFTPSEIAESLTRLAANDFNKAKIILAGGLQALTKMLCHIDPIEQIKAAECVMAIAMDVNLRPSIVKVQELLVALLELGKSSNYDVLFQCLCTLLVLADQSYLKNEQGKPSTPTATTSSQESVLTQQQSLPSSSQSLTAPMHQATSSHQEEHIHSPPQDRTDYPRLDCSPSSCPVCETHPQHNLLDAPQQAVSSPQQIPHPSQLSSPSNPQNPGPPPSANPGTTQSANPVTPICANPSTPPSPNLVTFTSQVNTLSPEEQVDDYKERLVDPQFVVDYLTFRGVFSNTDQCIQEILGNSNQQEQKETLLDHVLQKDGFDKYLEALDFNLIYVVNFKSIIQASLAKAHLKDGVYTNIAWNCIEEMLSNLTLKLKDKENYTCMEAYGYEYSLNFIKCLFSFDLGEKIGNYLTLLGYTESALNVISRINPENVLERNDSFVLTSATLVSCIAYSDVSKVFVKSLVDAGLIDSLTGYITEDFFLSNLDVESVSAIMTDFLTLLYNIAYHLDTKQSFKDNKTTEAIKNIPVQNEKIEITVMLTLLYSLDEQELDNLPDVSNVIENIIKYMKGALENYPTRRYSGMSLCELTKGLTVLAIKSSNRFKIAFKDEVALVLAKMFRHNDPREHISSARCLQALAVESTVRKKLLEFPDLVLAMEEVQKSGSLNVRKSVEDALARLKESVSDDEADETLMKSVRVNNLEHSEGPIPVVGQDIDIDGQATAVIPQASNGEHFNLATGGISSAVQQLARSVNHIQNFSQLGHEGSHLQTVNLKIVLNQSHSVTNNVTNMVQQEEKKFTARGQSEKLRPEDEQTIKQHWALLIEEVDATHIIIELISHGVFDVDDKREIMGHASRKKRTEIMLQKLLNAGPGSAFRRFMDVLERNHSHIVDKLREWVHET